MRVKGRPWGDSQAALSRVDSTLLWARRVRGAGDTLAKKTDNSPVLLGLTFY